MTLRVQLLLAVTMIFVLPAPSQGQWREIIPGNNEAITQLHGEHEGYAPNKTHTGMDIAGPGVCGREVHPLQPGKLVKLYYLGAIGNAAVIDHEDGEFSLYGHLARFDQELNSVFWRIGQTRSTPVLVSSTWIPMNFNCRLGF